jgi:hypothetical protein
LANPLRTFPVQCLFFPIDSDQLTPLTIESFPLVSFLRLLAKIAHGVVLGETKGKGFIPFLPDVILGHDKDAFRFIGSAPADMLAAVPQASAEAIVIGIASDADGPSSSGCSEKS